MATIEDRWDLPYCEVCGSEEQLSEYNCFPGCTIYFCSLCEQNRSSDVDKATSAILTDVALIRKGLIRTGS